MVIKYLNPSRFNDQFPKGSNSRVMIDKGIKDYDFENHNSNELVWVPCSSWIDAQFELIFFYENKDSTKTPVVGLEYVGTIG